MINIKVKSLAIIFIIFIATLIILFNTGGF